MTDARDETLADTLLRLWNAIEENGDKADVEFDRVFARNFDTILAALRAAPPATDTGMREALETAPLVPLEETYAALKCVRGCATDDQFQELTANVDNLIEKIEYAAFIRGRSAGKHYADMWREQHEKDKAAIAALSRPPHVADTREGFDAGYERDRATRIAARQSGENLPNIHMEPDHEMEAAYRGRALASGTDEKGRG